MSKSRSKVNGKILIASDQKGEAESLRAQLADDFPQVSTSFDPEQYVAEFERTKPDVLLLVFNKLEDAQSYYLGLYRFGTIAQRHSHRTIVFCTKDQVKTAFELCRKQYFDDYVLFWPTPYDGSRLPMSIYVALRELKRSRGMSANQQQLGDYAKTLDDFGRTLDQRLTQGGRQVESAAAELARNGERIGAAVSRLLDRLAHGGLDDAVAVRDASRLEKEFGALVSNEIAPLVASGRVAIEPLCQWASELQRESSLQIERAQSLVKVLGTSAVRSILVVDDDEFSRNLVGRVLEQEDYEVLFAGSGTEALNLLRKIRPSLILMDYMLPEQDGIEITQRLKQSEGFAAIPVIMLTGQTSRATVIRSLAAGAVDFVTKPIKRNVLLAKISKYVAR